jgi:hypothetical protein
MVVNLTGRRFAAIFVLFARCRPGKNLARLGWRFGVVAAMESPSL